MPDTFPDDENGDVLRRMQEGGDDLTLTRDIDFTVVFETEDAAEKFAGYFASLGYKTSFERTDTAEGFPWDVLVVNHMAPDHGKITAFEVELETAASELGGRNDGWGCMHQS
jgi:hypothetical protein